MADGSVIIKVGADTSKAEKDLAKLREKIDATERSVSRDEDIKSPLVQQAQEISNNMKIARSQVEKYKQALSRDPYDVGAYLGLQESTQNMTKAEAEFAKVESRINAIDRRLIPAYEKLDKMKREAGELQQNINYASSEAGKLDYAIDSARKRMDKFVNRVKRLSERVLVFSVILIALRSLRRWLGNVIQANDEAVSALARLKGALLTAVQPLVDVVVPALTNLLNVLSQVIWRVAEFTALLAGTTVEETSKAAQALQEETDALEGVGSAAKSAKKSLASFDEINKLGGQNEETKVDYSGATDKDWLSSALGDVAENVTTALLLGGISLIALGAAIGSLPAVLSGLFLLGAGVVAGTDTGVFQNWADTLGLNSVEEFLSAALLLGGIALIALGAAISNIFLVISGLSILGAGIAYTSQTGGFQSWAQSLGLDSVFDYVIAAMTLAGIALIVFSAIRMSIGLLIAGAALLGLAVAAESIGQETLANWWDVLKLTEVSAWVSAALYLAAIAFIVIGAATMNIGLLFAGALSLGLATATGVKENNGGLADWVTTLGLEKVAGWVTAGLLLLGIALVVIGILTANIALIVLGAGLLGVGVSIGITSGAFSSWLDTISSAFVSFKNTMVETFLELRNGIKQIINWIIGGIEKMANNVIDGINSVINSLNSLSFKMPDWLGGGSFGFNIPTLPRKSFPRLAEGAVIPPNREFLAVLGDQKSGTNIETPLETMVQAFRMALAEGGYGGKNEAYMEIDGEVFGRIVYNLNNRENRRVGVSLAGGVR